MATMKEKLAIAGVALSAVGMLVWNSKPMLKRRLANAQEALKAEQANGGQVVNGVSEMERRQAIGREIAELRKKLGVA